MHMAIDGARQEVQARGIKHMRGLGHGCEVSNGHDVLTVDGDTSTHNALMAHDLRAGDHEVNWMGMGIHGALFLCG